MEQTLRSFLEVLSNLNLNQYAECVSHNFGQGDKIELTDTNRVIWSKTKAIVELGDYILDSKWIVSPK